MEIIVWSPRADADFDKIIDYLLLEWGETVALDFADEVNKVLLVVSLMPELYPTVNKRKVRKAVVVKQITLYYRFDEEMEVIRILRLWDNRQDPKKLIL